MMYPLVLDLAADGVPVTVTCRVLGFSTQVFYKWRKAPVTQRDWDDAHLIDAALTVHADDQPSGSASSPTNSPHTASSPGRTKSPDCALKNASGRSSPRREG